ncbi:cell division protein ZapE, partial [Stenotrophomonas sp. PA-6-5C]|nr:cell division protein ZapE [Stenotrophomonas sp. PA-6-5C]
FRVRCLDEVHAHDRGDQLLITRRFKALLQSSVRVLVTYKEQHE